MAQYYRLDVQPDLFGAWGVVREWGRIGQPGQMRIEAYPTAAEAKARVQLQQAVKQGKGHARILKEQERG
jgi:predicted DNA-binding WGR domain protein